MSETPGPNTITLVSNDGVPIVVSESSPPTSCAALYAEPLTDLPPPERQVAERSMLIVNMMEDLGEGAGAEVPIPNVRPSSHHATSPPPTSLPTPKTHNNPN